MPSNLKWGWWWRWHVCKINRKLHMRNFFLVKFNFPCFFFDFSFLLTLMSCSLWKKMRKKVKSEQHNNDVNWFFDLFNASSSGFDLTCFELQLSNEHLLHAMPNDRYRRNMQSLNSYSLVLSMLILKTNSIDTLRKSILLMPHWNFYLKFIHGLAPLSV